MTQDSAAQSLPTEPSSSSPAAGAAQAVPKRDPKALTAKQQAVWDLKQKGKTYKEIAAELGISWPVVGKTLVAVYKKLGMHTGAHGKPLATGAEYRNPEKFAAVMDAVTDPLNRLSDALRAAGVPVGASEAILKRIRTKFYGAMTEVRNLKKVELDELLGKKIHLMLSYIDEKVVAEASARDLAMGVSQLIEKQQLIRGEPTQIISDHERKKIHELAPALLAEVRRRGLTVEGQVTGKTLEPA